MKLTSEGYTIPCETDIRSLCLSCVKPTSENYTIPCETDIRRLYFSVWNWHQKAILFCAKLTSEGYIYTIPCETDIRRLYYSVWNQHQKAISFRLKLTSTGYETDIRRLYHSVWNRHQKAILFQVPPSSLSSLPSHVGLQRVRLCPSSHTTALHKSQRTKDTASTRVIGYWLLLTLTAMLSFLAETSTTGGGQRLGGGQRMKDVVQRNHDTQRGVPVWPSGKALGW